MNLLAFDTSTEHLSVAVARADGRTWRHEGAGGAQSSATLIPTVQALLAEAGLALAQLDAIVFGRGPGSFTGLRTACSIAQGLAFGAGVPVLPVDTLLAVAEDARMQQGSTQVVAVLDARMDEVYAAAYEYAAGAWTCVQAPALMKPEALQAPDGWVVAGNARHAYAGRLPASGSQVDALPTAAALLSLAPPLLAAGHATSADGALPLYIRDKVAQTTQERAAAKAAASQP
ncbi:tRNA (adenosine(37)-N6)-threonylcarbamoyltransferase complex dimerization subunit type 1 TsaB [Ramlibacter albus]|uniref:tRNA (Adenosine(37)-N6)-threonylcarbamoyltransferase complex dimerization subunit type 1 TsaB n=1 Tax=Ramlibacter albus TaxID=2079448 RepID=A0A923M463_9BURK|nr:tRNA (adenosine(37)-N6)-threonylcarbamoyltransferase complex dimerization subunit type 1 TsaB [Ramlibacter albus]MBC5763578.1 tRNA (adenosine(37)-N6)-threonylcarbamoyltransferase complex dimerization subunit type 1 TsaB [Ramlibacter albus]